MLRETADTPDRILERHAILLHDFASGE